MNIEKMTTTMQQALGQAQQIAMVRKHQEIDILIYGKYLWNQITLLEIYIVIYK